MISQAIAIAENRLAPDWLIRKAARILIQKGLKELSFNSQEELTQFQTQWINELRNSPVALVPDQANTQHYEVPASFFRSALGEHLKYSCCYWNTDTQSLKEAEENMLHLTCERAQLKNGQDILELGCGWGSLSLWMAKQYPKSKITAVSNSNSQREFILQQAKQRGLSNLTVITEDMNDFSIDQTFDRVVSIEMFEHMRNYPLLFKRISTWLKPEGLLFVHIFVHKALAYPYEDNGDADWMTRYFFSGGQMPSERLFYQFQDDMRVVEKWRVNGSHYQKTARAWLDKTDLNSQTIQSVFEQHYSKKESQRWVQRWRMFFIACEEMFGFNRGDEWFVSHYLLSKNS